MIFLRKPYMIQRAVTVLFLLLCPIFLTSCFGNKAPERTYFSIDYALNTQPSNPSPKYPKTVVIQNITTALAYDRQEIVYRANPYEFQYYWYRLWASKPRKMLGELINSHLRYTNLFQHVSSTIEDKLPDYLLDIDISAIEELDVSDTEWYAHLALRFTLSRPEDNTTAWTYQFDAKRPVASNQPVYVVKAMSELLDAELVKAFQDLDNALGGKTKPAISDTPNKAVTEPPQATLLNKP